MKESKINMCILILLVCVIGQVHNNMESKTFRCKSGKYIKNEYFCDGGNDCEDRDDETGGIGASACNRSRSDCGRGKFLCDSAKSGQCKNITIRCNKMEECDDGTDELNCGDEINVKNCTRLDKFLCHDGLRCLNIDYTCDGYCNCFDCSDENSNCLKSDMDLLRKCPNAYFLTANGPQCLCDPNNNQSSTICKSITPCILTWCEQRCITFETKSQCSCYEGFHELNNTKGGRCRSDAWYINVVLFATMSQIKSLNVTSSTALTIQEEVHNCTALTAANDYVYYAKILSDNNGSAILKSSIINLAEAETLISTDLPITSLAVDYLTNNIYFTSNNSLSVCTNNGKICKLLNCCNVNNVVLAPKSGRMFYLKTLSLHNLNLTLIMSSNMDGSNENIFMDDVFQGFNITMTVDESKSMLYVLGITGHYYRVTVIERISFDAEFRERERLRREVRSLAVLNGEVFFIYDEKNDILHSKQFDSLRFRYGGPVVLYRDNSTPTTKFLFAYNALLQRSNKNPCSKSPCSGICFLRPATSSSSDSPFSYSCACDNTTQSGENVLCSNYHVLAANSGTSLVMATIFGFLILGIIGLVGYFIFLKQNWNWYQYNSALQKCQRNKRSSRIISDKDG